MSQFLTFAVCTGVTLSIQCLGFAHAFAFQTEKFYDIMGGVNFFAVALCSVMLGSGLDDPRKIINTSILLVSRGWLLGFLAWRAHERGGDSRFDEVKGRNKVKRGRGGRERDAGKKEGRGGGGEREREREMRVKRKGKGDQKGNRPLTSSLSHPYLLSFLLVLPSHPFLPPLSLPFFTTIRQVWRIPQILAGAGNVGNADFHANDIYQFFRRQQSYF
jgi:hypothetical protein